MPPNGLNFDAAANETMVEEMWARERAKGVLSFRFVTFFLLCEKKVDQHHDERAIKKCKFRETYFRLLSTSKTIEQFVN